MSENVAGVPYTNASDELTKCKSSGTMTANKDKVFKASDSKDYVHNFTWKIQGNSTTVSKNLRLQCNKTSARQQTINRYVVRNEASAILPNNAIINKQNLLLSEVTQRITTVLLKTQIRTLLEHNFFI